MVRIFCQQLVQERGAAPWRPDNEYRFLDGPGFQGLPLSFPGLGQPQAGFQEVAQVDPHQQSAQRMQVRLLLETVQQD